MKEKNIKADDCIVSLLPYLYDSMERIKAPDSFSMQIGNTEYLVNTHFNPNGRQTMFQQMKRIVLGDI